MAIIFRSALHQHPIPSILFRTSHSNKIPHREEEIYEKLTTNRSPSRHSYTHSTQPLPKLNHSVIMSLHAFATIPTPPTSENGKSQKWRDRFMGPRTRTSSAVGTRCERHDDGERKEITKKDREMAYKCYMKGGGQRDFGSPAGRFD